MSARRHACSRCGSAHFAGAARQPGGSGDHPVPIAVMGDGGESRRRPLRCTPARGGSAPKHSCQCQRLIGVFDAHFGAQDEFAHAFERRLLELTRQNRDHSAGVGHQIYERQDPPLRTGIGGQQGIPCSQTAGVVGHLALQEAQCVGAAESQHAQMRQRTRGRQGGGAHRI